MCQLSQDLGAFVGKVLEDDVLGLRLAEQDARRALVPVFPLLPDRPEPVRIKAVQLVRPGADERIELERHRICHRLKDVLGHDPGAAPPVEEGRVEPRVRLLQLEHHRVVVGSGDRSDIVDKEVVTVKPQGTSSASRW